MGILRSSLKFGLKTYITWCAIDYTVQQGLWSDSSQSIEAYNKLILKIKKIIPEYVVKQIPEMPKIPDIFTKEYIQNTWNTQIINASKFLLDSPKKISDLTNDLLKDQQINPSVK